MQELLDQLEQSRVQLWVEGETLKFRAPNGAMTDDLRAEIKARKPQLIAHLSQKELHPAEFFRPEPEALHEPFPLTPIQNAYLMGRSPSFEFGGVGAHYYAEIEFPGVDADRLQGAMARLIAGHPMLRAVLDGPGQQRILKTVPPFEIEVLEGTNVNRPLFAGG